MQLSAVLRGIIDSVQLSAVFRGRGMLHCVKLSAVVKRVGLGMLDCAVECNVHREGLGIIGSVRLSATLRGWGTFQREGLDMFSPPMQETRSLYYR